MKSEGRVEYALTRGNWEDSVTRLDCQDGARAHRDVRTHHLVPIQALIG